MHNNFIFVNKQALHRLHHKLNQTHFILTMYCCTVQQDTNHVNRREPILFYCESFRGNVKRHF